MLSVSTVLAEKASDVEQSYGEGAKLAGRRPPPRCAGRVLQEEGHMFSECAWVYGNGCVSECLYDAILARRLWTVEKDV